MNQVGNRLVGKVGTGSKRADGGEIKRTGIPFRCDDETTLVYDDGGRSIAPFQKVGQDGVQLMDVLFEQLGEGAHVMRIEEPAG